MKKFYFTIAALFFFFSNPRAQNPVDSVVQLIKKHYNSKAFISVYELGGPAFKQALQPASFNQVMNSLYSQLGSLNSYSRISHDNSLTKFKAEFTQGTMTMTLGLDENRKLKTFLFSSWDEPVQRDELRVRTDNSLKNPFDRKVDSIVQDFLSRSGIVGLSLGIWDGKEEHVYGYGETRKGNQQIPKANTLFEIGSITKTFTATLLAHHVISGKVSLNDPANKYLPDSISKLEFGKVVTLQSLSNHSSGLPRLPINLYGAQSDLSNPYSHYGDAQLFSYLSQFSPYREPGSQYEYSNLAVGLLGEILERVGGKPYEQQVSQVILTPLAMNNTKVTLARSDSSLFAQGHNAKGEAVKSWEFQSLVAAGGLRSNIKDMMVYAKAQLGQGAALNEAIRLTHNPTFTFGNTRVGLGWHITPMEGENIFGHNGQTGGYSSSMLFEKTTRRAVVILTNTSIDPTSLALTLMRELKTGL